MSHVRRVHIEPAVKLEPLLTSADVAERLGVSREMVLRLCAAGELPHFKLSRNTFRFNASDLDRSLRKLERRETVGLPNLFPRERRVPHGHRRSIDHISANGFAYFLEAPGTGLVKIGCSAKCDGSRLRELDVASPVALKLLAACPGGARAEAALHERFRSGRMRFEWFDLRTPELRKEITDCRRRFGRPHGRLGLPMRLRAMLEGSANR